MPTEVTEDGLVFHMAARAPGQVAAQKTSGASVVRGARSGNANFDPSSGRFASKQNKAPTPDAPVNPVVVTSTGLPQGVTQDEWDRRKDAVKDVARRYEELTTENVTKFLSARVEDLSKIDVAGFINDVKIQQLDDLADIFAQQLQRGTDPVSIKAPASYSQRVMNGLDQAQSEGIIRRLLGRGFSAKDIEKKVIKKIGDEAKREALIQSLGVQQPTKEEKNGSR